MLPSKLSRRFYEVTHLIVVVLITLSVAPAIVIGITRIYTTPQASWFMAISVCSWIALIMTTLILNITSMPYHRLALYGMLMTVVIYFILGFMLPAVA